MTRRTRSNTLLLQSDRVSSGVRLRYALDLIRFAPQQNGRSVRDGTNEDRCPLLSVARPVGATGLFSSDSECFLDYTGTASGGMRIWIFDC